MSLRDRSSEACGRHLRRYDSWQPVYNPAARRMEQRIVTNWRRLPVTGDWERSYAGEEPGMQVRIWLGLRLAFTTANSDQLAPAAGSVRLGSQLCRRGAWHAGAHMTRVAKVNHC